MKNRLFSTALCAIGGGRGGGVIPDWFEAFPALGIRTAHLVWAIEQGNGAAGALEHLRGDAKHWLDRLRALGIHGQLLIKRGSAGPWLTALADIMESDVVVTGPPADRRRPSRTLAHLLETLACPLLVLPGERAGLDSDLMARPLVDVEGTAQALALLRSWTRNRVSHPLPPLSGESTAAATRDVARLAIDTDATVLLLAGSAPSLALRLVRTAAVPLLIAPARVPAPRYPSFRGS